MGSESELTIVIPVLNEEEAIGKVLDELFKEGFRREQIVVVDGGSTDRTVDIAKSMGVKVVLQEGRGKADAIKTALKFVNTPYMLVMDGDYTYPAKYIRNLLELAKRCDLDEVIAARRYGRENIPIVNRFGNWVLTQMFNLLFGTKLSDVLSGMYLVKKESVEDLLFTTKGFSIESEIAAHIAATTGKIGEYPIEYRRRIGRKKLRVVHGIRIALDMVRLAWQYNPVFFIASIGALLLIPGIALGIWVAYHYLFLGIKYYVKGLIALFLTLIGLQSLFIAILALYLKRMEFRIVKKLSSVCRS
ncbi:MAG TPA: glycosyltransferase [Ignisphaera aggregans]|uniref:Glycosyltransferase n=1 Tax=Ignisphaera aggregans TaxID=334771 RepID=A0A832YX34_9CREN|nr:glycosyltransferase [Ignisphaera aggregans]